MEIQKRIVFAVELEFTMTSPLLLPRGNEPLEDAASPATSLLLAAALLCLHRFHEQSVLSSPRSVSRRQAITCPTRLDAVRKPK